MYIRARPGAKISYSHIADPKRVLTEIYCAVDVMQNAENSGRGIRKFAPD